MDDIFPYIEYVSSIGIVYTAEIVPVPEIIPDVSNTLFVSAAVCMYTLGKILHWYQIFD